MAEYKLYLCHIILWLVGFADGTIPAESSTTATASMCNGNNLAPVCPSGSQIAITSYHDGFKTAASSCPLDGTATLNCCSYNASSDCLQENPTESRYVDQLSGKSDGVISAVNVLPISGGTCDSVNYSPVSMFSKLDYLCIQDQRIFYMCASVDGGSNSLPLYLQNRNYPDGIFDTDMNCSCSVEAKTGGSIDMYIVHMDLYDTPGNCQQTLNVKDVDGIVQRTFNCDNEEFNVIKKETIATNYLEIELSNIYETTNAGKFWLGFQDTSGADIVVNCPTKFISTKDCGAPPSIANGRVENTSTRYGSAATYNCNTGYNMTSGDDVRYCGADGNWNGTLPVCTAVGCGILPQIANGTVSHQTTDYQSTATYSCATGYEITTGDQTRTCQADKSWSGTEPTCSKIDCGILTKIDDGSVSHEATVYGSNATYSCVTGYEISAGNETRTCQADKSWSGTEPKCSKVGTIPAESSTAATASVCSGNNLALVCPSRSQIAITSYHDGFKADSLNCPLFGTATGTCCTYDASGDCLQEAPIEPRYVDAFSGRDSGVISTSSAVPISGGTCGSVSYSPISVFLQLTYICIPDIRISPMCTTVNRERSTLPLYLQNWNYPDGIPNTDTSCSCSVEALSGGSIGMYTVHMDLYDTSGNCQQTLNVKDAEGNVLKTFNCDIEEFNVIQKDTLATNYLDIELNNNYATNNAGKFWIGFQGETGADIVVNCPAHLINCSSPLSITNGKAEYTSTRYGSIVTYTCNTGYNMTSGDDVRYCGTDGRWNGTEPNCKPVDCGNLPSIVYGSVFHEATHYLSNATYTCDPGYVFSSGNVTRSCQADKSWSGYEPTCSKIDFSNGTIQGGLIASIVINVLLTLVVMALLLWLFVLQKKYNKLVQQSAVYMDLSNRQKTVYTDIADLQ